MLFPVAVAMLVPKLEIIISLIGALFFSILGLFIPAVVEMITYWEKGLGFLKWVLWKDVLLVLLSLFAMISGTYISIMEAIASENGPSPTTDATHQFS